MPSAPASPLNAVLLLLALWAAAAAAAADGSIHAHTVSLSHSFPMLDQFSETTSRHLRLSFSDQPGQLIVTWSTAAPTLQSCAQLWPQPALNAHQAQQASHVQSDSQLATLHPSLLHASLKAQGARGAGLPAAEGGGAATGQGCEESPGTPCMGNGGLLGTSRKLKGVGRQQLAAPWGGVQQDRIQTRCGGSTPFLEPTTNITTQYVHETLLPPLDPGRGYLYRVGGEAEGWSEWVHFRAPRARQQFSEEQPASVLVVGDLGYLNSQTVPDLIAEVEGGEHDALLHIGDIAYDLQSLEGRRASQFLSLAEPLTSRLPYHVLPGNHDVHFNLTHYRRLFSMPNRQLGDGLFYSFDLGPLHVLVYNTEVFYWPELYGLSSMRLMYRWMEDDLRAANADRERTPWVLVAGHRPMYCVMAKGGSCDWGWAREHEASRRGIPSRCSPHQPLYCPPTHAGADVAFPIEELFQKYGVDVAVYGHSHCYERYFPVFNLTVQPGLAEGGPNVVYVDPGATVHVTSGAGGNSEMKRGAEPPPSGPCNHTSPWCAFQSGYAPQGQQSSDYSYSRVRAHNATHLQWEQYSSTLGRVVDSWWVVQRHHGPFAPLPMAQ